jgi:hypothetical protein
MAKNVKVAVVCQNLETVVANAIPLIQDLFYFEYPSTGLFCKAETEGPFIRFVARVTIDFEMQTHGAQRITRSASNSGMPVVLHQEFRADRLSVFIEA